MANYLTGDRFMTVTTPLAKDDLLVIGFSGLETISQLFSFRIDLLAENQTDVAFDKLLGQEIILNLVLPNGKSRFFCGICNRVGQGERDTTFTEYHLEIAPLFWMLTRRAQSRIFQQLSVPDILKKVLVGLKVDYEIQGTFEPRDYCVQYRETDFNFASRLMEEEGIYYFFKHEKTGHKMVLANTPQSYPALPESSTLIYEELVGGTRDEDRIYHWEKVQDLRSGKITLWDNSFELPGKHLEIDQPIEDSVTVGKVKHKLKVGGNDNLEIYDYPGEYAQRFDGIDPKGGDRPADLQKIFQDNKRTVGIRMQEEAARSLLIRGSSNCRNLLSGCKFTFSRHFNANGDYLLTSVSHMASLTGNYRSGEDVDISYENHFTCIPLSLPFVPARVIPKPVIHGTQTAVVVGPPGEEIFTDKYGRVKVQFHWDRDGKRDADSSCWVRVGTPWAGAQWGIIHIPRIGQEVIVAFEEGDPDCPIITGSVYNAEQMPPYALPAEKTKSAIKSNSSMGGGGFNEIRFEDKKGQEQVFIYAEKNQDNRVKADSLETVGNDRHLLVTHDQLEQVKGDKHLSVTGDHNEKVNGTISVEAGMDMQEKVGMKHALDAGMEIHLKSGMNVIIESGMSITLKAGGGFVVVGPAGVTISGTPVLINSGGSAGSGSGSSPQSPKLPKEADTAKPGKMVKSQANPKPMKPFSYSPQAAALKQAAQSGTPFCET